MRHAELQLVDEDFPGQIAAEQLDLRGVFVADAEVADLALRPQAREGLGDLLRLHQRVGAVQQQHVQMVHAQTPQAPFRRLEDVLARGVVAVLADADLALQDELLPKAGDCA